MSLIVKKYGGTSVATPEKIKAIARALKAERDQSHQLIVVVSAMGHFTDELVELSRQITLTPNQREFDMLLSTGERISIALLSMALHDIGCDAISFTGSQSGVFTDASHNNARVIDIKAIRVQEELNRGRVVIIAGFQGVNPVTKEITTLGRGGSDTTAVALASAFHADQCEILTDVNGLHSADPKIVNGARLINELDYETTLEMTYWGAGVLHYRCVEIAERNRMPVVLGLSTAKERSGGSIIGPGQRTDVKKPKMEKPEMETLDIQAINTNQQVANIVFTGKSEPAGCLLLLQKALDGLRLPRPQVLHQQTTARGTEILFTAPSEMLESVERSLKEGKLEAQLERDLATVTLTGRGLVSSGFCFDAVQILSDRHIPFTAVITTPLSLSFVMAKKEAPQAVQALHGAFVK